jgi:hypothetical protein
MFLVLKLFLSSQQVGQLLSTLQINPLELPAELPHIHDPAWNTLWQQQGNTYKVRPALMMDAAGRPPYLSEDFAAAGAQHEKHAWDNVWGDDK